MEITVVKINSNPDAQYVGRGSVFGNIYPITPTDNRDSVCDKYEIYFHYSVKHNPAFMPGLKQLYQTGVRDGYLKLGCFCKPNNESKIRCHADTIKKFLDNNSDLFLDHE